MTSSFSYFGQTMAQGCLVLFIFFSNLSPIPKLSGYILSWLVLELIFRSSNFYWPLLFLGCLPRQTKSEFMFKLLAFSNWFFLRQLLYFGIPSLSGCLSLAYLKFGIVFFSSLIFLFSQIIYFFLLFLQIELGNVPSSYGDPFKIGS
jgi:hypothetical protein